MPQARKRITLCSRRLPVLHFTKDTIMDATNEPGGQPKSAGGVVSTEERYKFVTSQCVYCNEKVVQSFSLLLKMVSAFTGGVIWLRLQPNWIDIWPQVKGIAFWTFIFLGVGIELMIFRNVRAWWGFRRAESERTCLAGPAAENPGFSSGWSR